MVNSKVTTYTSIQIMEILLIVSVKQINRFWLQWNLWNISITHKTYHVLQSFGTFSPGWNILPRNWQGHCSRETHWWSWRTVPTGQ